MFSFSIGLALRLMAQTAPFVIFRMAVYFLIAVAYVLVTGVGAGIGFGVGSVGGGDFQATSTFWGGAIGFALTAGVIYLLREYTLYIVKAGHIAVMVEALDGRALPNGQNQISYARTIVTDNFGQASVLFGIDQLVKGVLNAVTGLVQGLMSILPIPGLSNVMGIVRAYLRVAVGLLDEIILAHILRHRSSNPWASGREALVLYGQNARPMLINAAWVTLFVYGLSLVVFILMLAPAAALVYLIPGAWSAGGFVFRAAVRLGGQGGTDRTFRDRLSAAELFQGDGRPDPRSRMGGPPRRRVQEIQEDGRTRGGLGRTFRQPRQTGRQRAQRLTSQAPWIEP